MGRSDRPWRCGCYVLVALAFSFVDLSFADLNAVNGKSPPSDQDLEATVDSYLKDYVDGNNFSGTVLLARGDTVLLSKGYGMSVFEHATPNFEETRFQIASVSKSFTAAAILLLQERGELELHDPVSRFIPEFPRGNEITIRDLLAHTSGLPRFVFFPDFAEKSQHRHTTQDLVEWLLDKPLVSSPGEQYNYSNANYAMLAHIIEHVSNLTYGNFIKLNILDPMYLRDTGHRESASKIVRNLAFSYVPVGLNELERSRYFDYSIYTGSGSIYSTVPDLFQWFQTLQTEKLLNRVTRKRMLDETGSPFGYGWLPEKRLDRDALVMRGWDGVGFSANFVHFLTEDMTVIVLSNLNMSSITAEVANSIAAIGLDEEFDPLEVLRKPNIDGHSLAEMAGLYRFGSDFYVPDATIHIVESNGQLLIPANAFGPEGGLLPVSDNSFIHRQQWLRVTFERAADGKVTGMQYGQFKAKKEREQ